MLPRLLEERSKLELREPLQALDDALLLRDGEALARWLADVPR